MKTTKTLLIMFLSFLMISTTLTAGAFNKKAEEVAVKKTVQSYVKDVNSKNVSALKTLVHPKLNCVNINAIINRITELNFEDFLVMAKSGKLGSWKNINVKSVEITDKMAHVTLILSNTKLKQTQYISLFKHKKDWEIISILSTLQKK